MDLTDPELMEGVREGNLPSLEALVGRYGKALLSFFYFLTWDRHRADDNVQEVFRILWYTRNSRPPIGVPKLRLFLSALELSKTLSDAEPAQQETLELSWTHPFWTGYLEQDHWEDQDQGEWGEKVLKALRELPERVRVPLILLRYSGLDLDEVSELLGAPEGALREAVLIALDDLMNLFASKAESKPAPCREAPPWFPLPGESVPPADHTDSCPACSRRAEAHRDVWEHLADFEPPPMKEGLWPELKKALVSEMKVRSSYPTGRLPKPLPEEVRIGRRTSRFWMRFTVAASSVLAFMALYTLVSPAWSPERTKPPPPPCDESLDPADLARALSRYPARAPRPFELLGGGPDLVGANCTIRSLGSGSLKFLLFRVENPERFLESVTDPERPSIASGPLAIALAEARLQGPGVKTGSMFRFVEERLVLPDTSLHKIPARRTLRLEARKPGLYLAVAERGDFRAHALKINGTLGIVCRRTSSGVAVHVTDASGNPVPGVRLSGFLEGRRVPAPVSAPQGFRFEGTPPTGRLAILARTHDDLALAVCPPLREPPLPEPWLILDRPVLELGGSIRYLGFLPRGEGDAVLVWKSGDRVLYETPVSPRPSGLFVGKTDLPPHRSRTALSAVVRAREGELCGARVRLQGGWNPAFHARAETPWVPPGGRASFTVSCGDGDAWTHGYGGFAYRFRFHGDEGVPRTVGSGYGNLDAEGKAVLAAPAPAELGRVVLEAGPDMEALVPLAEALVASNPWTVTLEGDGDFAEVGDPYRVLFTLRDLSGQPVRGAEVRIFVVGAPLACDAARDGRTDEQGRFETEILFGGGGEAEVSVRASSKRGFTHREELAFPVTDGSPTPVARPRLGVRRKGEALRVLARGFGRRPLLTAVDAAHGFRSKVAHGEVAEFREGSPVRFFADAIVNGEARHAEVEVRDPESGKPRIEGTGAPWRPGLPLRVFAPSQGEWADGEFALIASRVPGAGLPFVPLIRPPFLSSCASSAGFRSVGVPEVGPFHFLKHPETEAPSLGVDLEPLLARLESARIPAFEIARFRNLDPRTALEELQDRIKRSSPLPALIPADPKPPEKSRFAPLFSGLPDAPRSWALGSLDDEGQGEAVAGAAPGTGRFLLTAVTATGLRWNARTRSFFVETPSRLHLSAPPLLRHGDRAQVGVRVRNASADVMVGVLRVGWAGTEEGVEIPLRVEPGTEQHSFVPVEAPAESGTIEALFRFGERTLHDRAKVKQTPDEDGPDWEMAGLLREDDRFSHFTLPRGIAPRTLRLARSPRDVFIQALARAGEVDVPGAFALAGKLRAFVVATRVFKRTGEREHPALEGLVAEALNALENLGPFRAAKGGFSTRPGGPEDRRATASVVHALAELEGALPVRGEKALLHDLASRVGELLRENLGDEETRAYLIQAFAACPGKRSVERSIDATFSGRHLDQLSPPALARLCIALKAANDQTRLPGFQESLRKTLVLDKDRLEFLRMVGPGRPPPDPVLASGLALQALSPFPEKDPLFDALLLEVLEGRTGPSWGTPLRTATIAAGLASAIGDAEPPAVFSLEFNALREYQCRWSDGGARFQVPEGVLWTGENFLVAERPGIRRIAWSIEGKHLDAGHAGTGITAGLGFSPLVKRGSIWVKDTSGKGPGPRTPVLAEVRVELEEPQQAVLVTVPVPAGLFLVEQDRIPTVETGLPHGGVASIREGRALFFFPGLPSGRTDFAFLGLVGWSGTFSVPPLVVKSLVSGAQARSEPLIVSFP